MTQETEKPGGQGRIVAVSGSRRRFLGGLGAAGALAAAPALIHAPRMAWAESGPGAHGVFTLGVASGDPRADSVVLWTRLAPEPLNGGGMAGKAAEVRWQVALRPDMHDVVRRGSATAQPRDGHAVMVNVDGLMPDTWYYYQFEYRGSFSPIGRTRTFPAPGSLPPEMRFALVSCQDYQAGFFAAYRDIATQPLDFVLHVGDYIYEYAGNPAVPIERRHTGAEIVSVEDYRNRYALYRLDPDLQAAHAAFPFIVTWDDHEVDNNYAALVPEDDQAAQAFRQRRTNAYQVYRETMPLRPNVKENNGALNLYRLLRFGALADIQVLDTRQYRTDQPCGDGLRVLQQCPQILDPAATLLGSDQEQWMFRNLRNSRSVWKVLAQQVMMMQWDLGALTGQPVNFFNVDAWDGYQVARNRIMQFLWDEGIQNAIVLTGDIHSGWAADLKQDFSNPSSAIVGAEFVCTSITSVFGEGNVPLVTATLPANPHIRFFDGRHRGYVLCGATPSEWVATFRAVTRQPDPVFTVPSANLPVFDLASFGLTAGQAGLRSVG